MESLQEFIERCHNLKLKNEELQQRIDNAIKYNEHLKRDAKYHLNLGHLRKLDKILKGEDK